MKISRQILIESTDEPQLHDTVVEPERSDQLPARWKGHSDPRRYRPVDLRPVTDLSVGIPTPAKDFAVRC